MVMIVETDDFVAFPTKESGMNMIKIVGLKENISFSIWVEYFSIKVRFVLEKKEGDLYEERTITRECLDEWVGQKVMNAINDWLHHGSEIYGRTGKCPWNRYFE